jgi:hypothetical protein
MWALSLFCLIYFAIVRNSEPPSRVPATNQRRRFLQKGEGNAQVGCLCGFHASRAPLRAIKGLPALRARKAIRGHLALLVRRGQKASKDLPARKVLRLTKDHPARKVRRVKKVTRANKDQVAPDYTSSGKKRVTARATWPVMPENRSRQSRAHKDRFQLPKMGIRKRRPVHRRRALPWLFVSAPNSDLAYKHRRRNAGRTSSSRARRVTLSLLAEGGMQVSFLW